MDYVDEALAWFGGRKELIVRLTTLASAHEGNDNSGRSVQIDLDTPRFVASATVWASGMCLFEAIDIESETRVIVHAHKTLEAPLDILLDGFLERLMNLP